MALFGILVDMRWIAIAATTALLAGIGCAPASQSPDAIRQNAANATATAARDAKAVAQGVFEGLKTRGPININRASKADLETLPGVDSATADKIIADRPYANSGDLVKRHIVKKAEYNQIADRIEAR